MSKRPPDERRAWFYGWRDYGLFRKTFFNSRRLGSIRLDQVYIRGWVAGRLAAEQRQGAHR